MSDYTEEEKAYAQKLKAQGEPHNKIRNWLLRSKHKRLKRDKIDLLIDALVRTKSLDQLQVILLETLHLLRADYE